MQAAIPAAQGVSAYLLMRLSGAAPSTLRRWAELGIVRPPTFWRHGARTDSLTLATLYRPIDCAAAILALALRRTGAAPSALRAATAWLYAAAEAGARWERGWVVRNDDGSFRLAELPAETALSVYLPQLDELPLLMRFAHDDRRGVPARICNIPSIRAPAADG